MIEAHQLTYRYPGAQAAAVSEVSFEVSPGEIFGLLGPSGAGKSTTQRVLTRQNRRFHGEAKVLARDLRSWDHTFYERIGVGFEMPNHYPRLTGRENLDFFASLYQANTRAADEVLDLVGLRDAADEPVKDYSKGMQMRLGFARALLHDPSVLFLDEPTAGLDPVNAAIVKDLIKEERSRGKTILLTTHNMADVDELCDRVGFLVEGHMSVVDAPGELKARYGKRQVRVEYLDESGEAQLMDFPLDGLGHEAGFLDLLASRPIRSIHSQEADLNRVFADVTGVRLGQGES